MIFQQIKRLIGSPADAGIDLLAEIRGILGSGFPRRRGDRPLGREGFGGNRLVPPQTRG